MHKFLTALILSTASFITFASPTTICGESDDRVLSYNQKIGRLSELGKYKGCTITMISNSCAITAGHCFLYKDASKMIVEFNVPHSKEGEPQASSPEDTYEVDASSVVYESFLTGNDYAVFKLKNNSITKSEAGVMQGFYNVSFETPALLEKIRITGFGVDEFDGLKTFSQQTHTGLITRLPTPTSPIYSQSVIRHNIDTTGGNSGSSIIRESDEMIIGVHTHGGCYADGGNNEGTLISAHEKFQEAIKACLGN